MLRKWNEPRETAILSCDLVSSQLADFWDCSLMRGCWVPDESWEMPGAGWLAWACLSWDAPPRVPSMVALRLFWGPLDPTWEDREVERTLGLQSSSCTPWFPGGTHAHVSWRPARQRHRGDDQQLIPPKGPPTGEWIHQQGCMHAAEHSTGESESVPATCINTDEAETHNIKFQIASSRRIKVIFLIKL